MTYMKAILCSSFRSLPLPPAAEAAEEDAQGHAWKKIYKKENINRILCGKEPCAFWSNEFWANACRRKEGCHKGLLFFY